ncbi:vesicle-mediated transport, partial [Coemansia sp. RSA 2671]
MSGRKPPVEARPQTQFFAAPATRPRSLPRQGGPAPVGASAEKIDGVSIRDVLRSKLAERTRAREEAKARGDEEWDTSQFVQLDREASDHVKSLIQQSDAIKRVRKERIFEDEVTEEEMSIIKQRVALQQQQFAEFERREFEHKARRVRLMYGYLDDEEIREALREGKNDADETIYQFSTPG